MQGTNTTIAAPPEPDDHQGQRGAKITPTEIAAVDELCNILARVLMRVQAKREPGNQSESGE